MADGEVTDSIDDLVQTKAAADIFVGLLDECIDASYSKGGSVEKSLKKLFPQRTYEQLLLLFTKQQVPLETIKAAILKRPVLQLTLAYEPNEKTIVAIREWCSAQFQTTPLLAISVDHSLIGGCIVSLDGYYNDYSVKKILEEKKEDLIERFIKRNTL